MKFLEKDVIDALEKTRSISEAARYLNVNRKTLYRYMKLYEIPSEKYSNKAGYGISKGFVEGRYRLDDILAGKYDGYKFNPNRIRDKLIMELIFPEKCDQCEFDERRITDQKVPLVLDFIDGDRTRFSKENLRFLCYNCAFLQGGLVGRKKEVKVIINPYTQEIVGDIEL